MASNKVFLNIEKLIVEREELKKFIINDGSNVFKSGDIVKCSYTKNKLYEVIKNLPKSEPTLIERVAVYDYDKGYLTTIGTKFLEKVEANKNTLKILYGKC